MTKLTLLASLQNAYAAMKEDPDLEDVDTLALMQEAVEDGLEYLTGHRPKQILSTEAQEEEEVEEVEEA